MKSESSKLSLVCLNTERWSLIFTLHSLQEIYLKLWLISISKTMRHCTKCTEMEVTQWIMNTKKNLGLREPKVRRTFGITIHFLLLYSLSCELHYLFCCLEKCQQSKKSGKTWNCCTYTKAQNNLNTTQSGGFCNIHLNWCIIDVDWKIIHSGDILWVSYGFWLNLW